MTFDLASLDTRSHAQAGVAMELIHPRTKTPVRREDGTPVTITPLGRNSDVYRDIQPGLRMKPARLTARAAAPTVRPPAAGGECA